VSVHLPGKAVPEMTYTVSGGTLNPTHSLTEQTFTTNGLWGKDECVKFWSQKVKGQGHRGVKYAPKSTFWP